MIEAIKERIALGRAGTADEAAGGIMLFCLPESDYVTGQILEVSGGLATDNEGRAAPSFAGEASP